MWFACAVVPPWVYILWEVLGRVVPTFHEALVDGLFGVLRMTDTVCDSVVTKIPMDMQQFVAADVGPDQEFDLGG